MICLNVQYCHLLCNKDQDVKPIEKYFDFFIPLVRNKKRHSTTTRHFSAIYLFVKQKKKSIETYALFTTLRI